MLIEREHRNENAGKGGDDRDPAERTVFPPTLLGKVSRRDDGDAGRCSASGTHPGTPDFPFKEKRSDPSERQEVFELKDSRILASEISWFPPREQLVERTDPVSRLHSPKAAAP